MSLTPEDRADLYADELVFDNLRSAWARESLEAVVDQIVARHVAAALNAAADEIETDAASALADANPASLGVIAAISEGKRRAARIVRAHTP